MSSKALFSRFLRSDPARLHVAAHSHHPWPDVTFAAHQQAWLDAATHHDDKWSVIFDQVVPEAQHHVARVLALPEPATVTFAPNTHEFLLRILSCLPTPTRILTTDSEFHSFTRQIRRLEEEGAVLLERVPTEPFGSFAGRFAAAAERGGHDLVFFSQVHFNSGHLVEDLDAAVHAVADPDTFVVIDGYHGFMAVPTDLSRIHGRAFYVSGGYKYAMAGEGAAFLHCPPGYGPRPVNTGWYAGFGALTATAGEEVRYATDGSRFTGATFDPSGLYRFNAVQRLLIDEGITVEGVHAKVRTLQERFLDRLDALGVPGLDRTTLLPPWGPAERGHFLTFRTPDAAGAWERLAAARVVTDFRADRLRFGFGLYHDEDDLDVLGGRLVAALGTGAPAPGR